MKRRQVIYTGLPARLLPLLFLWKEDLAATVRATIRACVMGKPGLPALRTYGQLWQFQMMMRSPFALASTRNSLFR